MLINCNDCCTGVCSLTITVKGCASCVVPGASVTIGATTLTTDGSGVCTFTGLSPGTYSVSVSATGYTSSTTSVTISGACTPSTLTINLTQDASHNCCTQCTNCITKKTIYITDSNGTWALTGSGCSYTGTATVSKTVGDPSFTTCSDGNLPPANCSIGVLNSASGTLTYTYNLVGAGGSTWLLSASADTCTGIDPSLVTSCASRPSAPCTDVTYYWDGRSFSAPYAKCPWLTGSGCLLPFTNSGGVFFSNLNVTISCDVSTFSGSGTLPSWSGGVPSDGVPASGSFTISA